MKSPIGIDRKDEKWSWKYKLVIFSIVAFAYLSAGLFILSNNGALRLLVK